MTGSAAGSLWHGTSGVPETSHHPQVVSWCVGPVTRQAPPLRAALGAGLCERRDGSRPARIFAPSRRPPAPGASVGRRCRRCQPRRPPTFHPSSSTESVSAKSVGLLSRRPAAHRRIPPRLGRAEGRVPLSRPPYDGRETEARPWHHGPGGRGVSEFVAEFPAGRRRPRPRDGRAADDSDVVEEGSPASVSLGVLRCSAMLWGGL